MDLPIGSYKAGYEGIHSKAEITCIWNSLISYESNKDEMDQILEMCAKLLWQLALT